MRTAVILRIILFDWLRFPDDVCKAVGDTSAIYPMPQMMFPGNVTGRLTEV